MSSQKQPPGTIVLNRKWILRLGGCILLVLAGVLFVGPLMGIGNTVYLRPIAWMAGFGVASLITAEFTDD